jgi:hypothetical protein
MGRSQLSFILCFCTRARGPTNNKSPSLSAGASDITGQLPTLPHTCACSTIGAEGLNFRVRDGNGWVPLAMITQNRCEPLEQNGPRTFIEY